MDVSPGFAERVRTLADRVGSKRELARRVGVSAPTVLGWLAGAEPYPSTVKRIAERTGVSLEWLIAGEGNPEVIPDVPKGAIPVGQMRRVRVLSWARAGNLHAYEELPEDWQEVLVTDCPDPRAFALRLEGDSMEPVYRPGDWVIVMPSFKPYSDSLVVAKLRDGDVAFKLLQFRDAEGINLQLRSYNPAYGPRDITEDDLEWCYPVYSHQRRVWNPTLWKQQFDDRQAKGF